MGKKGNSEKENKREVKESEKGKEETERKSQNSERKNDLLEKINDRKFQILCLHAINILELKIKILQEEMMVEKSRSIISNLTHRIKSPDGSYQLPQDVSAPLESQEYFFEEAYHAIKVETSEEPKTHNL